MGESVVGDFVSSIAKSPSRIGVRAKGDPLSSAFPVSRRRLKDTATQSFTRAAAAFRTAGVIRWTARSDLLTQRPQLESSCIMESMPERVSFCCCAERKRLLHTNKIKVPVVKRYFMRAKLVPLIGFF